MNCKASRYTPEDIEKISRDCLSDEGKKVYKKLRLDLYPQRNTDCPIEASYKFAEAGAICGSVEERHQKEKEKKRRLADNEPPLIRKYNREGFEAYFEGERRAEEMKRGDEERFERAREEIRADVREGRASPVRGRASPKSKQPSPRSKKPSPKSPKSKSKKPSPKPSPKSKSKKPSPKPSPKTKKRKNEGEAYYDIPYKSKKGKPKNCRANDYTESDIIQIAENWVEDEKSYDQLLYDLSYSFNTDCIPLAEQLTEFAKSIKNNTRYMFRTTMDTESENAFKNLPGTAQMGSTLMGSEVLYLTLKKVNEENLLAIISYTKRNNTEFEIGKAWFNNEVHFQTLLSKIYEQPHTMIYINCTTFSAFQLDFWTSKGMGRPYFSGNSMYLINSIETFRNIEFFVKFIMSRLKYYSTTKPYTIQSKVINYLKNSVNREQVLISSLIIVNNEFYCSPPTDIGNAVDDGVFFLIPPTNGSSSIPSTDMIDFLTSRLNLHFVGSITREGVYRYRFAKNTRVLLEYLSKYYSDTFNNFVNSLKQIMYNNINLNYTNDPVSIVDMLNKITFRNIIQSDMNEYISDSNQPIFEVVLTQNYNQLDFTSFDSQDT